MPLTLEIIQAEQAAQLQEERRPPFVAVDVLREFIEMERPPRSTNVSLAMCVLSIQEYDKYWKLELVDQTAEEAFTTFAAAFDQLDPARRGRFIFHLAIWKNRNSVYNEIDCTAGFTYHFSKVHALTDRFGSPSGSIQLREGFAMRRVVRQNVAPAIDLTNTIAAGVNIRAAAARDVVSQVIAAPTRDALTTPTTNSTPEENARNIEPPEHHTLRSTTGHLAMTPTPSLAAFADGNASEPGESVFDGSQHAAATHPESFINSRTTNMNSDSPSSVSSSRPTRRAASPPQKRKLRGVSNQEDPPSQNKRSRGNPPL